MFSQCDLTLEEEGVHDDNFEIPTVARGAAAIYLRARSQNVSGSSSSSSCRASCPCGGGVAGARLAGRLTNMSSGRTSLLLFTSSPDDDDGPGEVC